MCSIPFTWPRRWRTRNPPARPCCTMSSRITATGTRWMTWKGRPASVIHALRLLTHGDGVPYMDYVEALAEDPIARKVKAADLRHNMDASRLGGVRAKKYDLYVQALHYLEEKA